MVVSKEVIKPSELKRTYTQPITRKTMHFSTVNEWLNWITTIHTSEIELGLDRVKQVATQLKLLSPTSKTICVAGTNGKCSTVAGLEAIYRAAGYQVGVFTSPVLYKHNEQVKINGHHPEDQEFCKVFEKIAEARGSVSLTPFEFHTLAALLLFQQHALDLIILEVGLGGRLDAVNIMDADVAIITSIDIDHVDWLGATREKIVLEKAGIFIQGKPAVYGDFFPPSTLITYAKQLNTTLFFQGKDFTFVDEKVVWSWSSKQVTYTHFSLTSLALENMSIVLMAIELLQSSLSVSHQAIKDGFLQVHLPARVQIIPGEITKIFDVSHNPASVAFLAKRLKAMSHLGNTYAVFSMLIDKDMINSILAIRDVIDDWFYAPLAIKRGASKQELMKAFQQAKVDKATFFPSIDQAFEAAESKAKPNDRIIVFGSFHTVANVLKEADVRTIV